MFSLVLRQANQNFACCSGESGLCLDDYGKQPLKSLVFKSSTSARLVNLDDYGKQPLKSHWIIHKNC